MSLYSKVYVDFKELFLGYASLAIVLTSCLGGATTMAILVNGHDAVHMFQLFLVVAVCMWYNTTILANMKPKFVFYSLLASLGICIVLLVINLMTIL